MRSQNDMPWIGRALITISAIVAITVITITLLNFFGSVKGPVERHCDIGNGPIDSANPSRLTLYCDK